MSVSITAVRRVGENGAFAITLSSNGIVREFGVSCQPDDTSDGCWCVDLDSELARLTAQRRIGTTVKEVAISAYLGEPISFPIVVEGSLSFTLRGPDVA